MTNVDGGTPRSGPSALKVAGIGCLVLVIILIILGVYAGLNLRKWSANLVQKGIMAAVEVSGLPPQEQAAVLHRTQRLGDELKAGDISYQQLGQIAKELEPTFQAAMVYALGDRYVKPSAMSDEAKAQAQLALQRFARGYLEGTISQKTFQDVQTMVSVEKTGGQRAFKDKLAPAELEAVLAMMKRSADEAKVPDEPYHIAFAARIDRATQNVLGRTFTPPATESAPAK